MSLDEHAINARHFAYCVIYEFTNSFMNVYARDRDIVEAPFCVIKLVS